MPNVKTERAAVEIKREMTGILRTLKDPRITGMLTIVKVALSADFSHCKIYVSSLDGMDASRRAVKGLESAQGFIKRELGKRIAIRKMPELHFVADDSVAYSETIFKTLRELDTTNGTSDEDPSGISGEEPGENSDEKEQTKE